jgi:iron-sulfur cluster repair protein YtfE (RIC family)
MAEELLRRLSIDISDAGYQKLRAAKKRWRLNYGTIVDLLLESTDLSKLEEQAAELRTGKRSYGLSVTTIKASLHRLPTEQVEKIVTDVLKSKKKADANE